MKMTGFENVRLQCNLRYEESVNMGSTYGKFTSEQLQSSIRAAQLKLSSGRLSASDQFLRSINAVCTNLPHSNQAAHDAKTDFFSYLVRFGLPALFVTISPDPKRCFWIQVHLLRNPSKFQGEEPNLQDISDDDLTLLYKQRCSDRLSYPGLCAEEYIAICDVFIKDILRWDCENHASTGIGLFAITEAFTGTTEEQGRKDLHSHFMIWLRGWNKFASRVMQKIGTKKDRTRDIKMFKQFVNHCSSATTFQDFERDKPFSLIPVFEHEDCRNARMSGRSKFTVIQASEVCRDENSLSVPRTPRRNRRMLLLQEYIILRKNSRQRRETSERRRIIQVRQDQKKAGDVCIRITERLRVEYPVRRN